MFHVPCSDSESAGAGSRVPHDAAGVAGSAVMAT